MSSLPAILSPCEEALADGIERYIRQWKKNGAPTLGGGLPDFVRNERDALIKEVFGGRTQNASIPWRQWVEVRIPDRIGPIATGNHGQFEICLKNGGKRKA